MLQSLHILLTIYLLLLKVHLKWPPVSKTCFLNWRDNQTGPPDVTIVKFIYKVHLKTISVDIKTNKMKITMSTLVNLKHVHWSVLNVWPVVSVAVDRSLRPVGPQKGTSALWHGGKCGPHQRLEYCPNWREYRIDLPQVKGQLHL